MRRNETEVQIYLTPKSMCSTPPTKGNPQIYHNIYKSFDQVGTSAKKEETGKEKKQNKRNKSHSNIGFYRLKIQIADNFHSSL